MMKITDSTLESARKASQKLAAGEDFKEIEETPGLFISKKGTKMPEAFVPLFSFTENNQEYEIHTKV